MDTTRICCHERQSFEHIEKQQAEYKPYFHEKVQTLPTFTKKQQVYVNHFFDHLDQRRAEAVKEIYQESNTQDRTVYRYGREKTCHSYWLKWYTS